MIICEKSDIGKDTHIQRFTVYRTDKFVAKTNTKE